MAEFIRHEPCPGCGSSDALARYDDGSAHCFKKCGHNEKGGDMPDVQPVASPFGKTYHEDFIEGEAQHLGKRGIDFKTCEKFNYKVGTYKGKTVQVAEYFEEGKLIAQKVRNAQKKFKIIGQGKDLPLFGMNLWRDGGKRLIICEGEIDAMTVSMTQDNKWPVVSVPTGAPSAKKAIAKYLEWVESYESVVLCFDMDEAGQEAAIEVAQMLDPGRCKIVQLPLKDPNEMLMAGRKAELVSALWEAKTYRPAGVVGIEDVIEEACTPPEAGRSWPWESLTKHTYGIRFGEVYGLGGGTGCGKSTICKQIADHLICEYDEPVGLLMLEEAVAHTAVTMAGMNIKQRLHVPGESPDPTIVRKAVERLKGKAYFFDTRRDSYDWDTVAAKIKYMNHALGCRYIFLDHLTAIASTIETDERKAIDHIMAKLAGLAEKLDIAIVYISHLTTPEGTPHEEGGRVMERHFRGSRSIAFWSDFLFGIERDKQDQDGVTTFRILKDRFTGDGTGETFGLAYDNVTGLLNECPLPASSTGNPFDEDGEF